MQDLHELPKLADSLSYLYAEHTVVEQKQKAIELFDKDGATLVPTAALSVLLLGPGTRITHAAVKALADSGCSIVWVGEDSTRCYANGGGETRKAYHLLHQARLTSDDALRLEVCKRMYRMRFGDQNLDDALEIQQLRGMEGARVRTAYAQASMRYSVAWHGRRYKRGSWGDTDPINRALSAANALLNGLCHAAIVSGGYSPALGFIHTGKQLSFVYDIADLYKVEITIPLAFRITARSTERLEARVREACRQAFKEAKLLQRILPDIAHLLNISQDILNAGDEADSDPAHPEPLWDPAPHIESTPCADAADLLDEPGASPKNIPASAPTPAAPRSDAVTGHAAPATPIPTIQHIPRPNPEEKALRARLRRAEEGLAGNWIVQQIAPGTWNVTTRPDSEGYIIQQEDGTFHCTCPDFARTGLGACKHTMAVDMVKGREKECETLCQKA